MKNIDTCAKNNVPLIVVHPSYDSPEIAINEMAVWTIDDEERCRYFEANGVDAITSNVAAAMKAALRK